MIITAIDAKQLADNTEVIKLEQWVETELGKLNDKIRRAAYDGDYSLKCYLYNEDTVRYNQYIIPILEKNGYIVNVTKETIDSTISIVDINFKTPFRRLP